MFQTTNQYLNFKQTIKKWNDGMHSDCNLFLPTRQAAEVLQKAQSDMGRQILASRLTLEI